MHQAGLADLLEDLNEVNDVLRVSVHDLRSIDVAHVVVQDLLFEKVDESLDCFGHLLWLNHLLVVVLLQA